MPRKLLERLARRAGVLPFYLEAGSRRRIVAGEQSTVAILAGLGLDGSSEAAAAETLKRLDGERRQRLIEETRVVGAGAVAGRTLAVCGAAAEQASGRRWHLQVELEDGEKIETQGRSLPADGRLRLPELAAGYHRIPLHVGDRSACQSRIVVPPRCVAPGERLGREQACGLIANLYSVRSERNWGFGDLTDLAVLAEWGAKAGADFVGVNPLHAIRACGDAISPYSPISRLYRSFLYLDPDAIPEVAALADPSLAAQARKLRATRRIEYELVRRAKLEVLRKAFERFEARPSGDPRRRELRRYVRQQGGTLLDFATFSALGAGFDGGEDWPAWPVEYHNPAGAAVRRFRREHRREIDFHCWIQLELDRQLAACADRAAQAGMRLGVYQDLAIGTAGGGSDAWSHRSMFATGVSVGAPPDSYSTLGQDWGFPPLDPAALRRDGYRYWIRLLRNAFAHAGALRIDHILGLFRQFWIPAGAPPADGVYVRFPTADLLGILALESRRAGAVVVGEDLGTVPPGVPAVLARHGVLSSRVVYFEQGRGGSFRPASSYPANALVTVNTHDLSPLAGWAEGVDLQLRARAGAVRDDRELRTMLRRRRRDAQALRRRLLTERLLPSRGRVTADRFREAVHAFLRRTPAKLVGMALDDLAGEREPVNLPSVPPDRYPSWSRKMTRGVESLSAPTKGRNSR